MKNFKGYVPRKQIKVEGKFLLGGPEKKNYNRVRSWSSREREKSDPENAASDPVKCCGIKGGESRLGPSEEGGKTPTASPLFYISDDGYRIKGCENTIRCLKKKKKEEKKLRACAGWKEGRRNLAAQKKGFPLYGFQ